MVCRAGGLVAVYLAFAVAAGSAWSKGGTGHSSSHSPSSSHSASHSSIHSAGGHSAGGHTASIKSAGHAKGEGHRETAAGVQRDANGKIHRSGKAKDDFKKSHPCPATGQTHGSCPGYVIDHVVPL